MSKEIGMRSLRGLWVGDCIGNMSQLYNVHDVLRALKGKLQDVSPWLPTGQFSCSDDTEEAIVLYNHVTSRLGVYDDLINVDGLALEFATRFMERDPDGERFGYGLMTRTVLKDIYNGVPWETANKTYHKKEGGFSAVDVALMGIMDGNSPSQITDLVQAQIKQEATVQKKQEKVGSCGNGSAMRVAPLGALLYDYSPEEVGRAAAYSALPTHDHPEGIAGAMAIANLAWRVARISTDKLSPDLLWTHVLQTTPSGEVYKGLMKGSMLDINSKLGQAIKILGNGSHVTCQDTVPICTWLVVRGLTLYFQNDTDNPYEKMIEETSSIGGDVDTNCAIVGGVIGTLFDPPAEWTNLCKDMEGVAA